MRRRLVGRRDLRYEIAASRGRVPMQSKHLIASLLLATVFVAPAVAAPARPAVRSAPFPTFAAAAFIPKTPHLARHLPPDSGTYTVVDDPNAGNGYGQGTFPYAINSSGAVVGWYVDIYGIEHGFVRTPEGTYSDI